MLVRRQQNWIQLSLRIGAALLFLVIGVAVWFLNPTKNPLPPVERRSRVSVGELEGVSKALEQVTAHSQYQSWEKVVTPVMPATAGRPDPFIPFLIDATSTPEIMIETATSTPESF